MSVCYGWWRWGVLILLLVVGRVSAAPVELHVGQSEYELGLPAHWLRDSAQTLTAEELAAASDTVWRPSRQAVPNFGYSDDAIWFRLQLRNLDVDTHWYLLINYPLIRNLDVFIVRDGQIAEVYQTGDRYEFSARPIRHRDFVFPVSIPRGDAATVLVRISGPYSLQLPITLLDEQAMLEYEVRASLLHGLFFGFVLVMTLYNFFVYWVTRERSYLFYSVFSLSIGFFQAVQQGVAYQFIWPAEIWWQNKALIVFLHLSILSSVLFACHFLDLKTHRPWLYRAGLVVVMLVVLCLLLAPLIDELPLLWLGVVLSLPTCLLGSVGGWLAWRDGREDGRVFSLAWAIFLLGVLALALNKMGIVERNFFTEHGAEIGTVIELALLALALGGRINRERMQRMKLEQRARELERAALVAREHALELELMGKEQLERSVRERTDDLHRALAELSDMNRKLELLSTQDPVTGVGNENSFLRALKQEWERAFRAGESLSLMVVELDGYRDVVADYGQVAAEECLKSVAIILERLMCRPADVITRYGDKVFGILLPNTSMTGAVHLAQRVAEQVREKPFDFGICQVHATVSIGIACEHPARMDQHKELLLAAESAVYVAQHNGGNQIQQANPEVAAPASG